MYIINVLDQLRIMMIMIWIPVIGTNVMLPTDFWHNLYTQQHGSLPP